MVSFDVCTIQFVTQYQQAGGRYRLRSTTICGGWQSDPQQADPLVRGFDQEAAAVLMARIAVHRTETEEVTSMSPYYCPNCFSGVFLFGGGGIFNVFLFFKTRVVLTDLAF